MIRIGTSGWVYPHWVGSFYPPELAASEYLAYYARHFPTVEINRSFYRLPTREQFCTWREQLWEHPGFCCAVKASRYITHMKKLQNVEEGVSRLYTAAQGLGELLGPFLYQLPPHWHANPSRLAQFVASLPPHHLAAFEVRDATWFQGENPEQLRSILDKTGLALAIAVGGSCPTPLDLPTIGSFDYVRFHHGAHSIGLSEDELNFWARRLARASSHGRDLYIYFNNDPHGYAIRNAQRLRELLQEGERNSCLS
ncbi:DUF72 domain-containing protein [Ktedonosporobacter rubrisoli]|uniref:DUF72 domain-containing protein n=1 Tax=Ktedonosporobacter rubrisoli TaxID=2509675 RepID=A0A4P6JTM0_KTERU|nr:DUF72 domain-containing protein [Ktedonosporobacter rubrisoli]QBD78927.1 DUF72 domain-containing protein [Ktedonosporobacter rubrisoli]